MALEENAVARCALALCLILMFVGSAGCVVVRNRLDRFATCSEKAMGKMGGAIIEGIIEAPFNMLDHAIDRAIDPDHSCEDDPHDVCDDEDGCEPPTTGVVSDAFSQWKD